MNKKENPYGSFGYEKINAPKNTNKNQPRTTKTVGKGDLRGGKKS